MDKSKEANNEHSAILKTFFIKKINQDKINRKIKKQKKVSKKHKPLTFDFDQNQFRLVDKNNVAVLSVSRIAKRNTEELAIKNKTKIDKNKKEILKTKYQLLFEYKDIENYGNIYKDVIEPREEANKKYQKHIDQFENHKKEKMKDYQESLTRIHNQQEPVVLELKSKTGGNDSINKAENMQSYIEYQSELYQLSRENYLNSLNIDESAIKPI